MTKKTMLFIILMCLFSIYLSLPTFAPQLSKAMGVSYAKPVNFGLDLRGGVSMLMEVNSEEYIATQLELAASPMLETVRKSGMAWDVSSSSSTGVVIRPRDKAKIDDVYEILKKSKTPGIYLYRPDHDTISIGYEQDIADSIKEGLMKQIVEIIRKRVDEFGTKEIDLQTHGADNILLQVPGSDDPNQIRRVVGKTAKLTFNPVIVGASPDDPLETLKKGRKRLPMQNGNGAAIVSDNYVVSGSMLTDASVLFDKNNQPIVSFRLTPEGAENFKRYTERNVGTLLAIVLDGKILSAPVINEPIPDGSGTISGNFNLESANELALMLRAGALPASITVAQERIIGPSLGADSIKSGINAVLLGTTLVVISMILFYGLFGVFATIALLFNLTFIIGLIGMFDATLTLPGIAGIVLTLGMAVDANVLIFERIKEELRENIQLRTAIERGYKAAFGTILDSNITTIIAALLLYMFGVGPVRGFAVTLCIGLLSSMFTSIYVTKMLTVIWYNNFKKPFKNSLIPTKELG